MLPELGGQHFRLSCKREYDASWKRKLLTPQTLLINNFPCIPGLLEKYFEQHMQRSFKSLRQHLSTQPSSSSTAVSIIGSGRAGLGLAGGLERAPEALHERWFRALCRSALPLAVQTKATKRLRGPGEAMGG